MKKYIIRPLQNLDRKIQGLFLFAMVAFVLFAGLIYQQKESQQARRQWVDHTNQTIKKISAFSVVLSETESASRQLLFAKDTVWEKELTRIHVRLDSSIADLILFTADNPDQQKKLQQLQALVSKKERFQKDLTGGKFSREEVLQKISPAGEGPQIAKAIKNLLGELLQTEDRLLTSRIQNSISSYRSGIFITLAGGIFSFLLVLVVLLQLNADISRRKKAEAELIDSEAKYKSLIENVGVVMYTTDIKGYLVFANQQITSLTGYTWEELAGKHYSIFLDSSDAEELIGYYKQQFEAKTKATNREVRIRTKPGSYKWVELSALLLHSEDGPKGFHCMAKDITENKKTESELALSEAKRKENEYRLQAILDNSTALIYIKDTEGRYVMANKKFLDFLGVPEEKVIGHTDYDFTPPALADHYKKMDDTVFATRKPIESEETLATPEGNKKLLLLKFPLLTKEGVLLGVSGIATDITEKVEANRQHTQAVKKAETAQQIQEQFLANMSHEVRTPMNGISGMTRLLLDTELTEEQKNFTNMISRSLNNLVVIVNNVLDFSNLKTGKLVLDSIAFLLTDILDESKKQFAHPVANKKLDFKMVVDDAVPAVLTGDAYRLKQVLSNLIGNAIKFTNEGGIRLEVTLQSQQDQTANILFTLSDTGIGIPEDKLQTIFESFAQANKDISRGYGGSGLGLTISKELIELQSGYISVKSKPGEGAVFSFMIPFGVKKEKNNHSAEQDSKERLNGKRFLVVEDNLVNQRLISFVLQKVGIIVDVASNGQEAVTYFETHHTCDLVIMDLQMPIMDGYEAAIYIRQQLKLTIPIIAMTATALKEDQDRSREVGMNDFIIKPFDFNDLYKRLLRTLYNEETEPQGISEKNTGSEKLFDLSLLEELDDKDSLLDVLSMFFENTPGDVKELENLFNERKMEPLSRLAHKIKGAVSILQSARLTVLLKNIELQANDPNLNAEVGKDVEEVKDLFKILDTQLHAEWERINKEV